MPKRIFYISPGTDFGGGEVSLYTLIANLDRNRFQPIVCVYGKGRFYERIKALGCPVHILTYGHVVSQLGFVLKLARLIQKENAQLVHINTLDIRAGLAAWLSKRPFLGHLRVIFPTTWVDRTFVKMATKTISVSQAVRDHFCQTEGTSPNAFETIYNAVDISPHTQTANIRQELNLPPNTPLMGAIGRIDPWKGMETFIEAAAILNNTHPHLHFVIAGSPGPAPEEQTYDLSLKQRVQEQNLSQNFHFLGYRKDALSLIKQLNILIVPSRILKTEEGIKTEGFGRVAAEGLAMQTPVIASDVGGLPEIIEHEKTGLLFQESNPTDLSQKINHLLDHPDLCKQLTDAGLKRFHTTFSVDCHLHKIQSLYDQILSS